MPATADLEITLHRRERSVYDVDLRFSQPDSQATNRWQISGVRLDPDALRPHLTNPEQYGRVLTDQLFNSQPQVLAGFYQARSVAQSQEQSLRIRLFIAPSAVALHSVHWETLRVPDNPDASLLTSEHTYFSRYLSSTDWLPIRRRPRRDLRALVVIASPTDLDPTQLAPVDVAGELARAKSGLGNINIDILVRADALPIPSEVEVAGPPTLPQIQTHLAQGYDILYLVAHGALEHGEPLLWLETETGEAEVVPGRDVAVRLQELRQRPQLVVLASCQSAGADKISRSSDDGALAALGPRLAEIGVPAVVAMQGNITQTTIEQFMPKFFAELQIDGQIDRAVTLARGTVRERPDWWMPVLFMRLKNGDLWYTPGFSEEAGGLQKWPALEKNLKLGKVTPILGPGLTETLLGTRQEIARRWAETHHFPMAPHHREEMPQVAQFLAVNQEYMFPRDSLLAHLRSELVDRYFNGQAPPVLADDLDALLAEVGRRRREQNPADPYRVLAGLKLSIYITTNPGNLLTEALIAVGADPVVEICPWNSDLEEFPSIFIDELDYRPSPERPLVYHLFGRLAEPESLVLTEDDFFDFLIGVTKNGDLIPGFVRRQLVDTALLFLGFGLDDWDFRVLFRSIMSREGGRRRRRYAHVAVQVDPDTGRILEPAGARRYLESYFQDAAISIYWGSAEDFIEQLQEKLNG